LLSLRYLLILALIIPERFSFLDSGSLRTLMTDARYLKLGAAYVDHRLALNVIVVHLSIGDS
jgi:hypothetical protein